MCNQTDMHCIIDCSMVSGCLLSSIQIDEADDVDDLDREVIISCTEQVACFGTAVIATDLDYSTDIVIICDAVNACNGMTITVEDPKSFHLYCSQYSSCSDMHINIAHGGNNGNNTQSEIHCLEGNACSGMGIISTLNTTVLTMYEWSENVQFDNGYGFDQHIQCNNDRYIQYSDTQTDETISQSILDEYKTGHYPCDGVELICGFHSCSIEYIVNAQSLNLQDIEDPSCYWLNVPDVEYFR